MDELSTAMQSAIVNHHLDCDSKCVVYLLTCKVRKKQYVGQTTDKFRFRWNNYKSCQRTAMSNKAHTQAFFHWHFLGEKHNALMNDCDIVIIDKPIQQNQLLGQCIGLIDL